MMHLSRPPTTRYQAIAIQLENELHRHYRCGEYLPSEKQLAECFAVNRYTLRRAIEELVNKGLVQPRQGVGILVLMRPFNYPLHSQAHFSQNLLEQGSHPTSERLLAVLRPCHADVAAALACEEGDNVIHLRTLCCVNGISVCVINHYLSDLSWLKRCNASTKGRCTTSFARRLAIPSVVIKRVSAHVGRMRR
ncbi:putative transcriptional regulator PhnF [Sodalis glossinidius str. 'morsitans']|nr:phosphonate metabolism transcriptional regulator PhnF [Sodalis glossinidius]CRL46070.1 putative transcriptional regulator PhnF [Sodalis glossinidius str. 'morsitans']